MDRGPFLHKRGWKAGGRKKILQRPWCEPRRLWRGAVKPAPIDRARKKVNAAMRGICREQRYDRLATRVSHTIRQVSLGMTEFT